MDHEKKVKNIDNDKIWAVIAYIFFPIPLIFAKNRSPFLNYHINQGIILLIVSIIAQMSFGFLPFFVSSIIRIFLFVEFVMGISYSVKKEMKPLPVIGGWFSFLK